MPHSSRRYLTVAEVAAHLATTPRTVRNWITHGVRPTHACTNVRLRAIRLGQSWRIRRDDLAAFEAALAELT